MNQIILSHSKSEKHIKDKIEKNHLSRKGSFSCVKNAHKANLSNLKKCRQLNQPYQCQNH